jgi:hypothetical protein
VLFPDKLLPFDAAHLLYRARFSGAEDLVKGKTHLLLVPSPALARSLTDLDLIDEYRLYLHPAPESARKDHPCRLKHLCDRRIRDQL